MKPLTEALAQWRDRHAALITPEKAAYRVGFHAGMRRASDRSRVSHVVNGVEQSHCGCPLCYYLCDGCEEENMKALANTDSEQEPHGD